MDGLIQVAGDAKPPFSYCYTVGWPAPVKAASRRRREPKARLERGWPRDHNDRARLADGAAPGTNSVVYARVNVVVNMGNHDAAFIRRLQSGVKRYGIAHDFRITRTPSSNLPA